MSFGAGLLSIQRAQSVERASLSSISHLLKVLLVEFVSFKSLVCCWKVDFVLAAHLSQFLFGVVL